MIIVKLLSALVTSLIFYCSVSLFITQFYDEKRAMLLFKQRISVCSFENTITYAFISLSLGLVWFTNYLFLIPLIMAAFVKLIKDKRIKFHFTRRSVSLLTLGVITNIILCVFLSTHIYYILFLVMLLVPELLVVFFNYVLYPYESLIKEYYIKQAKEKIKHNKKLKIIAITGSFGKTSFKNYLYTLLSGQYTVIKTPGSVNTPMGICKFINDNLSDFDDYMILEVGVDAPNTMKKFFKIFTPDIGVITSIGEMHLATFKTLENIQKEKMELFANLKGEQLKVYNADCDLINVKKYDNCLEYSMNEIEILSSDINGTKFRYLNNSYNVSIIGKHQLLNLVGALKLSIRLGVRGELLKMRMGLIKAEKHRLSVEKYENTYLIDDAYNANLKGILEAIDVTMSFVGTKGIILNGIIEAGDKSYQINEEVAKALNGFDYIVLLDNAPKGLKETLKKEKLAFKSFLYYHDGLSFLLKKDLNYILLCSNAEKEYLK